MRPTASASCEKILKADVTNQRCASLKSQSPPHHLKSGVEPVETQTVPAQQNLVTTRGQERVGWWATLNAHAVRAKVLAPAAHGVVLLRLFALRRGGAAKGDFHDVRKKTLELGEK